MESKVEKGSFLSVNLHNNSIAGVNNNSKVDLNKVSPIERKVNQSQLTTQSIRRVSFDNNNEIDNRKVKYLTAKYGSQQMKLIRKRVGVETWICERLQNLYGLQETDSHYMEIDLDKLLDMDNDMQRIIFLENLFKNENLSPNDVKKFIDELLQQVHTL